MICGCSNIKSFFPRCTTYLRPCSLCMSKYQQSISPPQSLFKGLRVHKHSESSVLWSQNEVAFANPRKSQNKIVLTAMLPSNLRAVPRRHWLTVDLFLRWILHYPIAVRLLPPKFPISCRPKSSDWIDSTYACSFEGSRVDGVALLSSWG